MVSEEVNFLMSLILVYSLKSHSFPDTKTLSGKWSIKWLHHDTYVDRMLGKDFEAIISESGVFHLVRKNRTTIELFIRRSTNSTFQAKEGWFQLQLEDSSPNDHIYLRINRNDTLELHLFDNHSCSRNYKGIPNYCNSAIGTRNIPTMNGNATIMDINGTSGKPIASGMCMRELNNICQKSFKRRVS